MKDDSKEARDQASREAGSTPEEVGAWARKHVWRAPLLDAELNSALKRARHAQHMAALELRELPSTLSPQDLSQARWGVIVPERLQATVRLALRPLLDWRQQLMGEEPPVIPYPAGQSARRFLEAYGETFGTIRVEKLPYYLLIVASPEEIPFEVQYRLSIGRAVGRLDFSNRDRDGRVSAEDLESLTLYAKAVRDAEMSGVERPRKIEILSVENDSVLERLAKDFVNPIHVVLRERNADWPVRVRRGEDADKDNLRALLGGGETPALLMLSCHGRRMHWRDGAEQERRQGAPVCHSDDPEQDGIFTVDDLVDGVGDLSGLVGFFFCCYGVGTPDLDDFPHVARDEPPEAARKTEPKPLGHRNFLAALPLELLRRGALAVVGHVERGWTTSFSWPANPFPLSTTASLEDSLQQLLRGHRLGHAMRPMNRRYNQLATRLAQLANFERMDESVDLQELGLVWTALHDARNLIILGDPAVRLLGRRSGETMIRLDPELVTRLERQLRGKMSVERWVGLLVERSIF